MMVLSSVLLASSRHLLIGRFDPVGFGCLLAALVSILLIVVVVVLKHTAAQQRQRKMDRRHRLQYRQWHALLEARGELQPVASNLLLSKGEECLHVEMNAVLYEVRPVQYSNHTFGSVALGEGTGARIGKGSSKSEFRDEWRPVAEGQLYITNRQIYFDGDKQDRQIPIDSISTLKADWSLMEVSSSTRDKSMVFQGVNGPICRELIQIVRDELNS